MSFSILCTEKNLEVFFLNFFWIIIQNHYTKSLCNSIDFQFSNFRKNIDCISFYWLKLDLKLYCWRVSLACLVKSSSDKFQVLILIYIFTILYSWRIWHDFNFWTKAISLAEFKNVALYRLETQCLQIGEMLILLLWVLLLLVSIYYRNKKTSPPYHHFF